MGTGSRPWRPTFPPRGRQGSRGDIGAFTINNIRALGRMEDQKRERENRIGNASQVIIAVAVVASITILHVALILLLVDPIDDVQMASPRRFTSAQASAPNARRVLTPCKLQNFKTPFPRRIITSPLIPRARRVLTPCKLQNFKMPSPRRLRTSPPIPRARRVLRTGPLQNFKMPSPRRRRTSPNAPRAPVLPKPLQNFQMPSLGRFFNCFLTPARPRRFVSPAGF